MAPRNITIIAPFQYSYGTEEHLASDARTLGHTVHREPETRDLAWLAEMERAIILRDTQCTIYMRGAGLPDEATNMWRRLHAHGIRTASVHLDLYAGLRRECEVGHNPFWTTQAVFTADGGSNAFFDARGIPHFWLPAACVSSEIGRGTPREEWPEDVVFVGKTDGYHPEWPWRAKLIASLRARYGDQFRVWGHGEGMRGQNLTDLCASAKIVVGDTLALKWHTNYWSDRYYTTIGRGGFLVAPRVPGLETQYTDGEHFAAYDVGDLNGLFGTIDQYLDAPEARYEITEKGIAHTREHHTYARRIEDLLATIGL